jgi:hypothetical protein
MFLGADLPPGWASSAAEVKGRRSREPEPRAGEAEHGEDPPF